MRLNDTDKLYKKLTPLQAATLAFEANVRRDDAEMLAITEAQPRQYFSGTIPAYRNRFMCLTQLSLFYAAIYWKTLAILMQRARYYDEQEVDRLGTTLGSMEAALVKTCEQLAVNIDSVKQLGGIPEDLFKDFADEAQAADYLELFMGLC
jgi:hypothetical protein